MSDGLREALDAADTVIRRAIRVVPYDTPYFQRDAIKAIEKIRAALTASPNAPDAGGLTHQPISLEAEAADLRQAFRAGFDAGQAKADFEQTWEEIQSTLRSDHGTLAENIRALAAPLAPLDVERLARVYTHVRNAHGGNGTSRPDDEPDAPPCDWCRLAARQHIEAQAAYEKSE